MTYFFAINGVLRDYPSFNPIPRGVRLYHMLCQSSSSVVLLGSEANDNVYKDKYFLASHNLTAHDEFIPAPEATNSPYRPIVGHMKELRGKGYIIDGVFVSSPDEAEALLDAAIPSFLFADPRFFSPSDRPSDTGGPNSWSKLINRMLKEQRDWMIKKESVKEDDDNE